MPGFGLGEASVLKKITSDQVTQWDFRKFFVPYGLPKMIVSDVNEFLLGCSRKLPGDLTCPGT